MDRFELFKNLMVMAFADAKLTKEEIVFLSVRAERWGLTDAQVNEAIKHAADPNAMLTIPESKVERLEMLRLLIRTMAADGVLHEVEKRLFAVAAAVMGVSADELNQLLDSMLQ
jgi:uncharacterized tellurite resistance protein B-like protein